jgi:DNA gyrase subunit B
LFRIDAGKETYWALDEQQRDKILKGLPRNVKPEISRFKGLGEMPASDLKETTLDKRMRRALRVNIEDALEAETVISQLMGKDPQSRYEFIMERAGQADASELDL